MIVNNKEVLLLKSANDGENNKYQYLLEQNNFKLKHIKVLDFEFKNLPVLKNKLDDPDSYSGVIFTSPRSVDAVKLCLAGSEVNFYWKSKNNFVVGESTYSKVENELALKCKGKESGSANNLADLIVSEKVSKPYLFPCGNLKREILQTRLASNNIQLDNVIVYETIRSKNLEADFIELTSNFSEIPEFIVFFSPSGVKFTANILKKHIKEINKVKLIAIGPSTEEAIKNENFDVFATASKPTEVELLNAINKTE